MRELSHHEAIVVKLLHYNCAIIVQSVCNYRATLQENVYIGRIPLTFSLISCAQLLQTPQTVVQQFHDCCAIIEPTCIGDSTESQTIRESICKMAVTENRQKTARN